MQERDVTRLGQSVADRRSLGGRSAALLGQGRGAAAGAVKIEYTMARLGAERLWTLLHTEPYIRASGRRPGPRPCRWSRPG